MVGLGTLTLIADKEQAFFFADVVNNDSAMVNDQANIDALLNATDTPAPVERFADVPVDAAGDNRVIQARYKDSGNVVTEYEVNIYLVVEDFIEVEIEN